MFIVFFLLWIVMNGRWTTEIAWFGVGISAALYAFCWAFLGLHPKKELALVRKSAGAVRYFGLLLREILKCNLKLIRILYSHECEIAPKLITFQTPLKGVEKTILANSITLTPGTITVEDAPESNTLTVHCLNDEMADGIENCSFQQELCRMLGKEGQK